MKPTPTKKATKKTTKKKTQVTAVTLKLHNNAAALI